MHDGYITVPAEVRADGSLHIGYSPAAPLVEPTLVTLAGGLRVWIDAAEPDRFPTIDVPDLVGSIWALVPLLGEHAYRELLAHPRSEPASLDLVIKPDTAAWEALTRVGLLRWLLEYAPVAFDEDLLQLEIADHAARIAEMGLESVAASHLEKALPRLGSLLAEAREGTAFPEPMAELIERGVDIAMYGQLVDLDPATADAFRESADLLRFGREISLSVPPDLLAALRSAMGGGERRSQLIFRGGPDVAAPEVDRVFSVDWVVVPRGALSTAEETIRADWDVAGKLTVNVDADLRAAATGLWSKRLAFRVVAQDGTTRGGAALTPDSSRGVYTGTCSWPRQLQGDERVDVYSIDSPRPPLTIIATHEAAARRAASWAVVYERLADAVGAAESGFTASAAAAWGDALAHASHGRQLSPDVRSVVLLTEGLTRHYASALRRAGQNKTAQRVERRLRDDETARVQASTGLSVAEFQLLQPAR